MLIVQKKYFWFFDQEMAEAWRDLQVSPIFINPVETAPYTNGQTININYNSTGITYAPDNVFIVQISNVQAAFNYYTYPLRCIGYSQSSSTSGTITAKIPENIHAHSLTSNELMPKSDPAQYHYYIRVISQIPIPRVKTLGDLQLIHPIVLICM